MNPEIKKYIDTERSRGITDDQIKQTLMSQGGWSEGEIAQGFNQNLLTSEPQRRAKRYRLFLYIEIGLIAVFIIFKFMTAQFASYSTYVYQDFPVNSDIYCTQTYPELKTLTYQDRMYHACHAEHQKKFKEITEPRIKKYHQVEKLNLLLNSLVLLYTLFFIGLMYRKHLKVTHADQSENLQTNQTPLLHRPMFWVLLAIQLFLMLDIVFSFLVPTTIFPYFGVLYFILRLCKIFFPVYFFFYVYKHLSMSKEKFLTICIVLHVISLGVFIVNSSFAQAIVSRLRSSLETHTAYATSIGIPCITGTYDPILKKCADESIDSEAYKQALANQQKHQKRQERIGFLNQMNFFFLFYSTFNIFILSTSLRAKKLISTKLYVVGLVLAVSTVGFFIIYSLLNIFFR